MLYNPHQYQKVAGKHILDHPHSALFMEMGLGKTVITLTAINDLIFGDMSVRKVLIIAPLKVAETVWIDEIEKWDHLKQLKVSLILGDPNERIAAIRTKAHIYIINRENVAWLVAHHMSAWPYDMVVIDELSNFKNHESERFKALRMVRPKMQRVVGLTGTPSPNGLADLWAQIYLIDMGERLGKTISVYRNAYLREAKKNGHIVYKYAVRDDEAKQAIYNKIGDLVISMRTKDHLDLPERNDITVKVKLPADVLKQYEEFEDSQVLEFLDQGVAISPANAAALLNKLLQFGNGAVYKTQEYMPEGKKKPREWIAVHDAKLDALDELIEAAGDEPILLFYEYGHDWERISKRFKYAKKYEDAETLKAWNAGKIKLLCAHPASVSYGLNMQQGGHIIAWYGVPYSLELWDQGNARIYRQGLGHPVFIYKLICSGTADIEPVKAIDRKSAGQNELMDALNARINRVAHKYKIILDNEGKIISRGV